MLEYYQLAVRYPLENPGGNVALAVVVEEDREPVNAGHCIVISAP